ncbi:MAG: TonB-dependent receptor plug domain-containing protein, partial [Opitutaceae bacterium]
AQAAAINEQKVSPNIKNVVVLDEFGDLGDGNIGEYLKYTPGLSIVSGPQTAATASIRGMPAGGVIFMVDGAEVSTPSIDRNFDLAASSAGSVDRIEVTKVPTPDRPANAVGGTVNIVGKSGFANPRRQLRINTYAAYNSENRLVPPGLHERVGSDPRSNERAIQPGFDLNYSHPVNKSVAFTVNLSSLLRVYDMDYDNPLWDMVRGRSERPGPRLGNAVATLAVNRETGLERDRERDAEGARDVRRHAPHIVADLLGLAGGVAERELGVVVRINRLAGAGERRDARGPPRIDALQVIGADDQGTQRGRADRAEEAVLEVLPLVPAAREIGAGVDAVEA